MVTQAPETSPTERAQRFIEGVKAGRNPPTSESLTPEIAAAVEASMDNQDEANRAKIRDALNALRATAKPPEGNEGSLSSLFEGAKSDLMKGAPKLLDAIIDPQLNEWKSATGVKLTGEQKMNIKLAIIDRIVSGAASEALFGSLKSKLNAVSEKFSKFDLKNISLDSVDSLTKEFSLSGDDEAKGGTDSGMEGTIKKQIEKILAETLGQIRGAYEANPQPAGFTDLLMHPKALADYKSGEDIPTLLARSGNATLTRLAYREGIKQKILSLESSILGAEKTKNKVMDFLTKLPDFATDKLFGAFEWLFKIPIIGDLIATFFGYSSGKTLIEDLKLETRDRRSIQSLMEYGNNRIPMKDGSGNMVRSGNGEIVYSEGTEKGKSNGEIKLLENINFTELNYKDIKPFYKTLRDNGINPNQKDFWKTVFGNEGKIETGEGDTKKTLFFPKWDPKTDISATKIVEKLNRDTKIQKTDTPAPIARVSAPPPPAISASVGAGTAEKAPPLPPPSPGTPDTSVSPPGTPAPPETTTKKVPDTSVAGAPAAVTVERGQGESRDKSPLFTREQLLAQAFREAQAFPFSFGNEVVDFRNNILLVGNQKYTLEGKRLLKVDITGITLSGTGVQFEHMGGPTVKPKSLIIENLPSLLAISTGTNIVVESEGRSLIITRTA